MTRTDIAAFALMLGTLAAAPVAAQAPAPARCPEGRTLSGACVSPALAQYGRTRAVLASQSRISYSAPLTMPRQDNYAFRWQIMQFLRSDGLAAGDEALPMRPNLVDPMTGAPVMPGPFDADAYSRDITALVGRSTADQLNMANFVNELNAINARYGQPLLPPAVADSLAASGRDGIARFLAALRP